MSDSELSAMNREFGSFYAMAASARGFSVPAATDPQDAGGWVVQAMYLSMGRWHDYRDPLRRVPAPVLVIHGGRDFQTEAESRMYAESFPHARFVAMRDAGHFPFTERPEEFAAITGRFLSEPD